MSVGVVGLGLIGGSLCRALKAFTDETVRGLDVDEAALESALLEGAVDAPLPERDLASCETVIVALYPETAAAFIESHAGDFAPGTLVTDVCGLKKGITARLEPLAREARFDFVGVHPMAGREKSGFSWSTADLFRGASLIVTPYPWQDEAVTARVWAFYRRLGFSRLTVATPDEHDEMIAYTSQLAHLLTVAYMLDPLAARHEGFSAGSFRDMTRVARINEELWSELFIENREYLCREADDLAGRVLALSDAARQGDRETLRKLLRQSRETKERMM